ncbi:MAG: hypothetical protein ACRDNL_21135 [Spirillospora sp.]
MAMGAVIRELERRDQEAVWRAWLNNTGETSRRWKSPIMQSAPPHDLLVDTAWRDWLKKHNRVLWSLLKRWDRPAPETRPREHPLSRLALGDEDVKLEPYLLVEAASRFDHPIGEAARTRLVAGGDTEAVDLFCALVGDSPRASAFCVAHGLAPSDDVQRAVFFVRTGQLDQHQALDPEGALLALAYESASTYERGTLRLALTELGGVDLLRVLAGRRSMHDFAKLSKPERTYLLERLREDGDREREWSLTLLLPLVDAAYNVHRFYDWRPSGALDRRLFGRLRAADIDAMRTHLAGAFGAPLGLMGPEVLAEIRATLADPALSAARRSTLELLRDCLEYRFSDDIEIGDGTGTVIATDDDIELGG